MDHVEEMCQITIRMIRRQLQEIIDISDERMAAAQEDLVASCRKIYSDPATALPALEAMRLLDSCGNEAPSSEVISKVLALRQDLQVAMGGPEAYQAALLQGQEDAQDFARKLFAP